MGADYKPSGVAMFEYQAPAVLNQAAPVQNTWYTILDTTRCVCVYQIGVGVEDTDETLECQITVDGETIAAVGRVSLHSTELGVYVKASSITLVDNAIITPIANVLGVTMVVEGHSVKVQVRKTTATGIGNLTGIVTWGQLAKTNP